MAKWIHRHYLLLVSPLRKWADGDCRLRVCEVGSMVNVQVLASDCQSVVNRVGPAMCTNCYKGKSNETKQEDLGRTVSPPDSVLISAHDDRASL